MKAKRHKRGTNLNKLCLLFTCAVILFLAIGYGAFSTDLSINIKGNIKNSSRVIKSYANNSKEDFRSDLYRDNIVSITFLNTNYIPSSAVKSFDISEDSKNGVVAYLQTNTEDNSKYDLYIGADGGVIANEDSSYIFSYFSNLTNINFNNNYDTSNMKSMSSMFLLSYSLPVIDVSEFNTDKLEDMSWAFAMYYPDIQSNSKLTKIIGIEDFNTSNVTNLACTFRHAKSISGSLDLSNWNTSKVTNMVCLFDTMMSLTSLNVSNWNVASVINFNGTFNGLTSMKELNICSWDTSNAIDMRWMFAYSYVIDKIYVGPKWDTSSAYIDGIFRDSNISEVTKLSSCT